MKRKIKQNYCNNDNNSDKVIIYHQNVQHLPSRIDLLDIILSDLRPDIVALCEHKMNSNEIDLINLDKYKVCNYYVRSTAVGGGVLVLALKSCTAKRVTFPSVQALLVDKEFECCLTEFRYGNFKFVLASLYRSPITKLIEPFLNKLDFILELLASRYKNLILCGDININVLERSKHVIDFSNILKTHNVKYLVDFPTRVTDTSQSGIDNFMTNMNRANVKISGVITEISDHDGQILEILNVKNKTKERVYKKMSRNYSDTNIQQFLKQISKEDWQGVYLTHNVNKFNVFFSLFFYYFDVNFPKTFRSIRNDKKVWIREELRAEHKKLIELNKLARLSKNTQIRDNLKLRRKIFKQNVLKNKKIYIDEKISSSANVVKSTWNIINSEVCRTAPANSDSNMLLLHDGNLETNPLIIGELLNTHFINSADILLNSATISKNTNHTLGHSITFADKSFKFKEITVKQLNSIISSFDNKKSSGFDEVPMTIIKEASIYLLKPLAHIINTSFLTGNFPEKLKLAKVKPLYKNGEPTDSMNYRPLSLLSSFSKIFERVVHCQLLDYLVSNKLLDNEQHGFQPGKSVLTAAVEFIEQILESVDKKHKTLGIFMDLSKAFDSVCHVELLMVLNNLGVREQNLKWFESYLCNRRQYVVINHLQDNYIHEVASSVQAIKHGVPQGSILGPLLFLCYLKGLPGIVSECNGKICLYADDANLIVTGKNQEQLEIDSFINLAALNQFFITKNLLLNSSKTKFINFSTQQARLKLKPLVIIDDQILEQTSTTKFLGLIIDEHLTWDAHINHVLKKISNGIFALYRMSKISSTQTLRTIYFSLIQSHIQFGIGIYGATTKANLDKILLVQKKAIRIMLGLSRRDTVKHFFFQKCIF